MVTHKYSNERLAEAVKNNVSYAGVMKELGIPLAGGNHTHIKNRITRAQLNTAHFTGQAHGTGKISPKRKTTEAILVVLAIGSARPKPHLLRRAMEESGTPYRCRGCANPGEWQGKPMTLEIDHIDGNWLNNLLSNLRFMCPNCHSLEPTNRSWKNN